MSVPTLAGFEELFKNLSQVGEQVETELNGLVNSSIQTVSEVGRQTLSAGGKRLRPAFVSLAARATGREFDPHRAARLGACLELVHMATLIHDDVIDNAATRRGKPTASSIYGKTASILTGDVMLAKAMVVLADDGDLPIIRTVSRAVVEMAEGEAREVETRGRFDLSEDDHLHILRMKTASFVECCCSVGAQMAGASKELRKALESYGHHVGMAFQIVDDLLDFRGDRQITGKPQATDFREGCATLPLIRLRANLADDELRLVSQKFGNGVSDDEVRLISGWMQERGAFREAESAAQDHINIALAALEKLPAGESRELLAAVTEFVLSRQV
jgi:geranylgeranyl pyrophosphate synthase